MTNDQVLLVVDGIGYGGWKDVQVTAGIDRQARSFSLTVTDRWPGNDIARRVSPGDLCELWMGADKVLTGYVDATPVSFDSESVTVKVNGRSKTADLVDCSVQNEQTQWKKARLEQIAQELAAPFGIKVLMEVSVGEVPSLDVKPGDSPQQCLDSLLTSKALLATDDAEGNLVLTRAGVQRADTALVVGVNVLSGSAGLDFSKRFGLYRCRSQRPGNDTDSGRTVAAQMDTATDKGVRQQRVLDLQIQVEGGLQTLKERVLWEATYRAGSSFKTTYAVQGWRQASGRLWLPNMRVQVQDPIIGFDMEMLISEVTYHLGENGTTATLSVAPVSAYEQLPDVPNPVLKKSDEKKTEEKKAGGTTTEGKKGAGGKA